jgi:hypothetical protein
MRPLRRPRKKWKNNIKIDLQERESEDVHWNQWRFVVDKVVEPSGFIKGDELFDQLDDYQFIKKEPTPLIRLQTKSVFRKYWVSDTQFVAYGREICNRT